MNKLITLAFTAFLLLANSFSALINHSLNINNGTYSYVNSNGWTLEWHDEFDNNLINKDFWTMQKGANIWGNNELEYYTGRTENCFLEDGKLKIIARREEYQDSQYTSARIITKGKVDFSYGKIDVRAKLPKGQGLWPAIWLLPSSDTYNDRKKNGEIDIMEMLGHDTNTVYGTIFSYINGKYTSSFGKYRNKDMDFSDSFHTFSLEWNKNEIKWLVDNKLYNSFDLVKNFTVDYKPFSKNFYMIINLAVGGDWPGSPSHDTIFPSIMEIEYVRYYTKGNI